MAQDDTNKEDKFDFDSAGEALGYISLAQARLLAMQTARESPGDYGDRFDSVPMVFAISESAEDDDYYNIVLDIRPSGHFVGSPGREQFFISKEGEVALRQVIHPPSTRGGSPAPIVIGGLVVVLGVVAITVAVLFDNGYFGPLANSLARVQTEIPAVVVAPMPTSTPTAVPVQLSRRY